MSGAESETRHHDADKAYVIADEDVTFAGEPGAVPDPPARRVATRLTLVEALRNVPLTGPMTREALVKMADSILGQLPEALPGLTEDQVREISRDTMASQFREAFGAQLDQVEAAVRADERARIRPILEHKIAVAGGQYDDAFGSDAREAIAESVTEALDDLDSPGDHYATFDGDAYYIIDHPARCCATARDLCEPAAAAIRIVGHGAQDGRWRITGISEGLPDLERVEPQP